MGTFADIWNNAMAIGTIILMIASLGLIYVLVIPEDSFSKRMSAYVSKHFLLIGFLISLGALLGSQVYEHVIGFPPCILCWYARIAIYPMVLLFGMAMYKKDTKILDYTMALSIAGMIISGYHSIVTVVGESPLPCSADGISCLTRYVYQYGFISIPLMVFVCFVFIFLVLLTAKRSVKKGF